MEDLCRGHCKGRSGFLQQSQNMSCTFRAPNQALKQTKRHRKVIAALDASCEQHLPIQHHFSRLENHEQLGCKAGVAVCAEVGTVRCFQSDKKLIYKPIKKGLHSEKVRPDTTCKGDYLPGKERDAAAPIDGVCPPRHAHQSCTVFE